MMRIQSNDLVQKRVISVNLRVKELVVNVTPLSLTIGNTTDASSIGKMLSSSRNAPRLSFDKFICFGL